MKNLFFSDNEIEIFEMEISRHYNYKVSALDVVPYERKKLIIFKNEKNEVGLYSLYEGEVVKPFIGIIGFITDKHNYTYGLLVNGKRYKLDIVLNQHKLLMQKNLYPNNIDSL